MSEILIRADRLKTVKFGTRRISAYVFNDSSNRVAFEDDVVSSEDSTRTNDCQAWVKRSPFRGLFASLTWLWPPH